MADPRRRADSESPPRPPARSRLQSRGMCASLLQPTSFSLIGLIWLRKRSWRHSSITPCYRTVNNLHGQVLQIVHIGRSLVEMIRKIDMLGERENIVA